MARAEVVVEAGRIRLPAKMPDLKITGDKTIIADSTKHDADQRHTNGFDLGRVEGHRLVERRRALPSRKEAM